MYVIFKFMVIKCVIYIYVIGFYCKLLEKEIKYFWSFLNIFNYIKIINYFYKINININV